MEITIKTIYGEAKVRDCMIDLDGKNLEEGVEVSIDGVVIAEVLGQSTDDINALPIEEFETVLDSYIH